MLLISRLFITFVPPLVSGGPFIFDRFVSFLFLLYLLPALGVGVGAYLIFTHFSRKLDAQI